jgi:hypothetical protein
MRGKRAWPLIVAGMMTLTAGCGTLPASGGRVAQQAPIETSLSFELFGTQKAYKNVTAEVGTDEAGKPQTTVRAVDGENTLDMVVQGSGVGEHPVRSVTIKDEKLGGRAYSFDASDSRMSGTVTFTEFDPAAGKVVGTFTASYRGFPPVSIQQGQVTAMTVPTPAPTGMTTAGQF